MKKTSLKRRGLSLLLALVMILGYIPAVAPHAHAASNVDGGLEGQAADVFTALGFDTSVEPEGYDADTVDNPYGRTKVTGTQIWEALVAKNNGITTVGAGNGDENNDKGASDVVNATTSGNMPLVMYAAAPADFDNDGLTGEAVYVGTTYYPDPTSWGDSMYLKLYTYDAKTDTFSDELSLGHVHSGRVNGYDEYMDKEEAYVYLYGMQNMMQVTAGDYDGDGFYEIAVYVPAYNNARVDVYKQMKTASASPDDWKTMSNWSVVWSYILSNDSVPNMVSLHSADINQDGMDDLSIAYGEVTNHLDYYLGGLNTTRNDVATKSSAVILWGDRNKMLQKKHNLNLEAAGLGELARVSITTGDLDNDKYNEVVVTGQPLHDVFANKSRSAIIYKYDGTGGLVKSYAETYKICDGYYSDGEWVSNNGFDKEYYSTPYMKTNAAVFRPEGYDYSFLYLDSCLFEYVEGVLNLKMCLDDEKYDSTNTLNTTWLKNDYYTEFGAVAMDMNGDGYQQLFTSYYDAQSALSATTIESDMPSVYYNVEGGLGGLRGDNETLIAYTTCNTYSAEPEFGGIEAEWPEPETLSPNYVIAVNCDMDTVVMEYTGNHWLTYQDPKVLAVVAAAPYFEDVDVICDYDYAWQNTTSWSKMEGGGHGTTVQVDLEAGAYISQGTNFNELEVAALFTMEWAKETVESTEYTLTFETSQDEDAVAFFSIPTEHYEYTIYKPNAQGVYETDYQIVSRPFQAVYQVLNLDYYESIRGDYSNLPAIRGEILKSTPGDPASYPASTSGYDVIAKWNDDPAGVSFGNGAITQEITITKEESESYNLGAAVDVTAGGGFKSDTFEIIAGVTFSLNPSGGWMDYEISGTTISGTVTNMPLEFQDYGYYYDWALFSYAAEIDGGRVPVVSYVVNSVSEPPQLPDDFQQDVERTTSDKNVLTWTYDGEYSSFILYRYFDFPIGGGLQEIARFKAGETPYTIKYDENQKPYYEFYYEDLNLAPYSEYEYAIQVERLSEIPPLSAPSGLLTARTKAAVGNPVLTIEESDGTNDGYATVYPDKNSYLIAQVTGPDGEKSAAYYTTVQYQWQKMSDQGQWEDLINETNQTLTIASAGSDTAGKYRCRVNVITNTDNTAISSYTGSVELVHSKRTSVITEAYAKSMADNVELYAKVGNAHTDSATVPDGYVTFNFVNTATGENYPVNVPLNAAGVAKVISENGLPEGQYRVTVTYSGSYVFKSSSTEIYYLSGQASGYAIEAMGEVTYGEGAVVEFKKLSSTNGMVTTENVDAASFAIGVTKTIQTSASFNSSTGTRIYAGDAVKQGEKYHFRRGGFNYSFTASADGTFTGLTGGIIAARAKIETFTEKDYLTKDTATGVYRIKDNTPAGTYQVRFTDSSGNSYSKAITITRRSITLQLPELVKKQDSGATMGDLTFGQLPVVYGGWAPCDMDGDGNVATAIADISVEPKYINTAGTAFYKDAMLDTCGYYTVEATGTLANYTIVYRPGSLSVIGGNQPVTFGVRDFEGQTVGTLYMVSPDYAYTREEKGITMSQAVGSRVVFTAAPDEGYQVYDWYVNGVPQGITDNRFAYVMLNQDVTIEVQFVFKPDTLLFGIAGDAEGGTLTCSDENLTSGSIVIPNSYVTFTAQAKEGYHFKEWRYTELGKGTAYYAEDDGKMSSTFELLMPKNSCSVYAVFQRDGYQLTYTDKAGINGLTAWYWGNLSGDTTAQLEKITVESGDAVPGDTEVVIQAKDGYQLDENYNFVSIGSQGVADYEKGTYTLILTGDTEVTGYTVQNDFDVTVSFDISKTYAFCEGAQVVLTVDGTEYIYDCPQDDTTHTVSGIPGGSKVSIAVNYPGYYVFEGWDVNGTVKSSETFTVSQLGENTTFTLKLTEKPVYKVTLADISGKGTYNVTLPAGAGQEGNVVTCHENDPLLIQVVPGTGNTVTYWNVASADAENSWETKASSLKYQFPQLTANYTFTPIFSGSTYHIVSWPTLRYYGVNLKAEEGYLTTVSDGEAFKFTLSGGEDQYEYVLVNGQKFYDDKIMGDHYPYRYLDVDGVRVYTIYNITADQEISISATEPVYGVNITPATAEVGAGKTVTFTAQAYGVNINRYTWTAYWTDDSGFHSQVLQKGSSDNTLIYTAPVTPGQTVTIGVQAGNADNGIQEAIVAASATVTITDAVDTMDITAKELTADSDGNYLVYPITPTNTIGKYDFDAKVTMYSGATNADVTWSLWGAQMRGTSIDADGVLTVSIKEYGTNSQLKVIATYTYPNGDTDKAQTFVNLCPDAYVATEIEGADHGDIATIGYVSDGTAVTVTATPDENHAVAKWYLDGVAVADHTANELTFTAKEMTYYSVAVEFTHYYPEFKHDDVNHWYECSCGARTEVEEHYDFDKNHHCDKCDFRMSECDDADRNHFCDWCSVEMSVCSDVMRDHYCDWCSDMLTVCQDEDLDHNCDWCGVSLGECADENSNHFCDHCGKKLTECADENRDHNCDVCGRALTECGTDENKDHLCDICSVTLSQCADQDKNHQCDYCGQVSSQCQDENNDHKCDLCEKELSTCADDNADHNCDICGKELSTCADDNADHNCDICGKELSTCADEDNNHLCDGCNKELSTCADENADHKCDICGKVLTDCADSNNDHDCDTCGKHLTPCTDENADDICDVCGKEMNIHDCVDENADHKCDNCGKELSTCADANGDHNCDTCGAELSQCADTDNDHACDICEKKLSDCVDSDNDHKCNTCGETVSDCADKNGDHNCDTCGTELSQCADSDDNHLCDTCNEIVSHCADENNDHNCDVCGVVLTVCLDDETDHKCDICDAELNLHADENTDHKCDLAACGKKLSDCADENDDHACDLCGKTLSDCADENDDHLCDLCGDTLSSCTDENGDHKCDICGKVLTQCKDESDPADGICDICGKDMHECVDEDQDHKCDTCGYQLTDCTDEDNDHSCDICGKTSSLCTDGNNDHDCDVCGDQLTECTDADDHKCDICGKTVSECVDADHNDKCDICGAKTNFHTDKNKDHRCDVCAIPMSECADTDKDHNCDLCGVVWSVCVDVNKDHICDICGGNVGVHANSENSHICEYCGDAFSVCADADDHKCDVCGLEISQCDDPDKNHFCDICGKELSKCSDENNDHFCDLCGAELSKCMDEDADEKCDICGATMRYAVTLKQGLGGTMTADKEIAAKGETVTVTVEVTAGRHLETITATAADGTNLHVTDTGNGVYTFQQGRGDAIVEASFGADLFDISFASMTMANSLDMNFAFKQEYREDWSGYYAKIEKEYEDAESAVQYIFFEDWKTTTISGEQYYYVTFTGIAAKEMTDLLYVTIFDADGTAVSAVWEDSVQAQAMRNLAKSGVTELAQTMVVDMLNYGTAAQQRFEYNLNNLANSRLTQEQKAFATKSVTYVDTSNHGNNYRANVYLVSNIQFMMAFTGVDETMNAVVSFKDHYGVAHEITIPGSEFTKNGSYYVLTIEETVMADAYQEITCKIYDANGKLVTNATDSVASYAARAKQNTGNDLYEMIVKFATSAYAYLHNK